MYQQRFLRINNQSFALTIIREEDSSRIKIVSIDHPEISYEGTSMNECLREVKKQIIKKLF